MNPKQSLCFNCKHGFAILQESEINQKISGIEEFAETDDENVLGIDQDSSDGDRSMTEKKTCSVCFWSPENVKINNPVMIIGNVTQCSRYEKKAR